jgi:hypothetical protein
MRENGRAEATPRKMPSARRRKQRRRLPHSSSTQKGNGETKRAKGSETGGDARGASGSSSWAKGRSGLLRLRSAKPRIVAGLRALRQAKRAGGAPCPRQTCTTPRRHTGTLPGA